MRYSYSYVMAGRKGAKAGERKNLFGAKLKAFRLAQGIALRDMAARLEAKGWEVSEGTWGHVEAGRRLLTDIELALALKVLRRKFSDLD